MKFFQNIKSLEELCFDNDMFCSSINWGQLNINTTKQMHLRFSIHTDLAIREPAKDC